MGVYACVGVGVVCVCICACVGDKGSCFFYVEVVMIIVIHTDGMRSARASNSHHCHHTQ